MAIIMDRHFEDMTIEIPEYFKYFHYIACLYGILSGQDRPSLSEDVIKRRQELLQQWLPEGLDAEEIFQAVQPIFRNKYIHRASMQASLVKKAADEIKESEGVNEANLKSIVFDLIEIAKADRTDVISTISEKEVKYIDKIAEYFCIDFRVKDLWPLHEAAIAGKIDRVKSLIDKGFDINAKDNDGQTPLERAAYNGQTKTTEFLIDNGADIEARGSFGYTALMCAVISGNIETAELLIDRGANMDMKLDDGLSGYTALMLAAMVGLKKPAKWLIEKGANIGVIADDGETALSLAKKAGLLEEIVEILEKRQ